MLATFQQLNIDSRKAASVGPTVLHTHLCILPSKSKSQLGVTMQVWHQDSIQCHMLDFRGKGELQRKENFIEWIKGSTLLRSSLINRNNVRTPIQFRKRKAIPESWNIFLSRANLSVFISITPVIWMVKWSKLSIPSIEINKPLPTLAQTVSYVR